MITVLFVALAGGLGAVARFAVDGFINARARDSFPYGTIVINLTGSLLAGFVAGLGMDALPETAAHIIGAGFLGGYTTFSAACFDTLEFLRKREWGAGLFHAAGLLVASVFLAVVGLWLGLAA